VAGFQLSTEERVLHYTGFFVGGTLLVGAAIVRAHATRTWLASGQAAQQADAADGPSAGR
jgi:hypothetical protein